MSQTFILSLLISLLILITCILAYFFIHLHRVKLQRLRSIIQKTQMTQSENLINIKMPKKYDLKKKLQNKDDGNDKEKNVLRDQLDQAGLYDASLKQYFIGSTISCLVMLLLGVLFKFNIIVILFMSIIGFFGLPRFFIKFKTGRRQKKFLAEFADALESMVRLLKAGMPMGEAILMVSREFEGPVGEEMTKIYEEQKIGVPMGEACVKAARRMPLTEMQMFATGIMIQQQTGSSLSEVLLNLAKVIRARFRLKRKIQALSAEAKASASIIGALPILVGAGLTAVNPEYMEPLFQTLKGKMFLTGAGCWMLMGILIMRQMINFRI
jgi:tight adherence protein B